MARGISEAAADPALLDDLVVKALGDSSARVYWASGNGAGRFLASVGSPSVTAPGRPGWEPIGPADEPIGGLAYDHTLIADTGLVGSVAAPLALAIEISASWSTCGRPCGNGTTPPHGCESPDAAS